MQTPILVVQCTDSKEVRFTFAETEVALFSHQNELHCVGCQLTASHASLELFQARFFLDQTYASTVTN